VLTLRRELARPALPMAGSSADRVARYAVPSVLAAGWLTVVLTHRRMPYPSDQLQYLQAAAGFPEPTSTLNLPHQMTRFGFTAPTRLVMTIFGYSETSYYTVPVLGGLLLLLGTYAIGALLFSRMTGVAAAVILIFYAPVFYDSTELLPDLLATGLFTAAVALAIAVRQRRLTAGPRVLVLIGIAAGWSYLVREFIVFVWPIVPVLLWPRLREGRPLWRGLLWLAIPVIVVGAAETLLCLAVYGDPLARVRAVVSHGKGNPYLDKVAGTYRNKPVRVYLAQLWSVVNGNHENYYAQQWIMRPLLLATAVGVIVRPRRLGIFGLWIALLWVPLTLLGGVLNPGNPKLQLQLIRYWYPIIPAFVLGGIATVWLTLSYLGTRLPIRGRPHATGVATVVVACVAGASLFVGAREWSADPLTFRGEKEMAALRTWMGRAADRAPHAWTDEATAQILAVYRQGPAGGRRWTAEIRRLGLDSPGPAPGDLVVLFDTDRGQICGHCRIHANTVLGRPVRLAPHWQQIYTTSDALVRVYSVGASATSPRPE
jgi:4-amino-4-deoxy-L-arabinose transferase-like glycosyltransferase